MPAWTRDVGAWTLIVALATLLLTGCAFWYTVSHDTKTDWSEIRLSMSNVLAAQKLAFMEKGSMGAYSSDTQNAFVVRQMEYEAAVTQLRGRLNRVDDHLAAEISATLDQNKDPAQWLSDGFVKRFQALSDEVAARAH